MRLGVRGPARPRLSVLSREARVWGGGISQGAGRSAAPGQPASCLRLAAAQPAGPKAPAPPDRVPREANRKGILVLGGRPKRGRVLRCIS